MKLPYFLCPWPSPLHFSVFSLSRAGQSVVSVSLVASFSHTHIYPSSSSCWFPVPLVKDFPSQVFFPHCPSLSLPYRSPAPPQHPHQCHCVHMAPACDTKLSQNTPDALFSLPLFQTLLNFKQNKRKGKERGRWGWWCWGQGGCTWYQGNVQQHHNLIHSLIPVHHQERAPL